LLFGELEPKLRSQYTAQYNLGIQHQLTKDMVLSVGYVGSQGHRLLATRDINFGNAQSCIDMQNISDYYTNVAPNATLASDYACGPFFADSSFLLPRVPYPQGSRFTCRMGRCQASVLVIRIRPWSACVATVRQFASPRPVVGCPSDGVPVFSSIFAQDTIANSNYNSLQASLERRMSHGLQFELAYTFSKSIDNASSFENILKPICDRCNRSLSLFDARHRFVISYLWTLPVPEYQGAKGKVLNGWQVSGITTFQTGFPIRVAVQQRFGTGKQL